MDQHRRHKAYSKFCDDLSQQTTQEEQLEKLHLYMDNFTDTDVHWS